MISGQFREGFAQAFPGSDSPETRRAGAAFRFLGIPFFLVGFADFFGLFTALVFFAVVAFTGALPSGPLPAGALPIYLWSDPGECTRNL